MAWNLREYDSLDQLKTLLGGQSGSFHNSLKVYRTREHVVVAQYEEPDHEVVLQFGLGSIALVNHPLLNDTFDHIEGVDDARRLIVGANDLSLAVNLLPSFQTTTDPSIEMRLTQYLVQTITNTPVRFS